MAQREYFRVTYDVVTEESAQDGDVADQGWAAPGGWRFAVDDPGPHEMTLREAIGITGRGLEDSGSWFSTVDPEIDYRTGEHTTFGLHPPEGITASSYARLRRVLCGR